MPEHTASDSSFPRRRRARTSIATLVALSALGACAQVLAPASAGAMTDPGQTGGCTRVFINLQTEKIEGRTSDGQLCEPTENQILAAAERGALQGDLANVFGKAPTLDKAPLTGIIGLPDRRGPASRPNREWQRLGGLQGGSKPVEVKAEKKQLSPEGECTRLRRVGQMTLSDEEWKAALNKLRDKGRSADAKARELEWMFDVGIDQLRAAPKDKAVIKRVDDIRKDLEAARVSASGYRQAVLAAEGAREEWTRKNCEKLIGAARKDR